MFSWKIQEHSFTDMSNHTTLELESTPAKLTPSEKCRKQMRKKE
jgi:hypothetical protein